VRRVGVTNARKVVVPPLLLEQRPQAEVTQILKELRSANAYLLDLVKDSKRLVAAAFKQTGLEPPRDGTGRFAPRRGAREASRGTDGLCPTVPCLHGGAGPTPRERRGGEMREGDVNVSGT
jgi:hypothetical protein